MDSADSVLLAPGGVKQKRGTSKTTRMGLGQLGFLMKGRLVVAKYIIQRCRYSDREEQAFAI